jgi:putative FmdB family regulatory protein
MPTYEYTCKNCDEHLEVVQSFKDDALTECPACGGPLRKVFGNIGITFKGSGFYRTDSRSDGRKGTPKSAEGSKGGDSKTGETKSGETKSGESKSGESKSGESKSSEAKSGGSASGGSSKGDSSSSSSSSSGSSSSGSSSGSAVKAAS